MNRNNILLIQRFHIFLPTPKTTFRNREQGIQHSPAGKWDRKPHSAMEFTHTIWHQIVTHVTKHTPSFLAYASFPIHESPYN